MRDWVHGKHRRTQVQDPPGGGNTPTPAWMDYGDDMSTKLLLELYSNGGRERERKKVCACPCPIEDSLGYLIKVGAQGTWGALGPNYTVDMTTGVLSVL